MFLERFNQIELRYGQRNIYVLYLKHQQKNYDFILHHNSAA